MRMTTTRNGMIAGIVVVCVGLLLAADAQAQPGPGFRGDRPGAGVRGMLPGLRDLDLTDTQRDTIRGIAEQNQESGSALGEQLRLARLALNEAVMAESFNESDIRTLATQVAALEADAAVQRAYVNSQIWMVLTADQKVELRERQRELKDEREARRGDRGGRRGLRR